MKRIIPIIIMMICAFTSCLKDDDIPVESATDQQAKEIASVLNGTFVNNDDDKNIHEITFTPYPAPKEEEFTIPGDVDIDKKVTVYGECKEVEYIVDYPVSTEWRYIIDIPYEGAQPELWFYPISLYGRYETHDITIINSTSFILDDKTYYKQ